MCASASLKWEISIAGLGPFIFFLIKIVFATFRLHTNKASLPDVGWLVDRGLTSHSAIFQLFSDGTDVQFSNFDLLPGTQRHGQLGVLNVQSLPQHGTGTSEDVFYLLAISGPTRGEGKPGIEFGSSDPKSSPLPLDHRGGHHYLKTFHKLTKLSLVDLVKYIFLSNFSFFVVVLFSILSLEYVISI